MSVLGIFIWSLFALKTSLLYIQSSGKSEDEIERNVRNYRCFSCCTILSSFVFIVGELLAKLMIFKMIMQIDEEERMINLKRVASTILLVVETVYVVLITTLFFYFYRMSEPFI